LHPASINATLQVQVKLRSSALKSMDIAEVARRSGTPASTLRFYEEKGLIRSIGRRGLRRLFEPMVMQQLALIALGRAAGFSLDEIATMFAPDGKPRIKRDQLTAKADELDRMIRRLATWSARHSSACCGLRVRGGFIRLHKRAGVSRVPPTRAGTPSQSKR
jgi:DNA-binding transcriptional MerR regulator